MNKNSQMTPIIVNKKALHGEGPLCVDNAKDYFTFAESSAPGLNLATRLAAILISLPV
jgi:hypothetical protein